jgi:hypothetical protein
MSDARGYRGELKLNNGDILHVSDDLAFWVSANMVRQFRFRQREPFVVGEPARFRAHVFDSMGIGKWAESAQDDEEGLWFIVTTAPIAKLHEAAKSKR